MVEKGQSRFRVEKKKHSFLTKTTFCTISHTTLGPHFISELNSFPLIFRIFGSVICDAISLFGIRSRKINGMMFFFLVTQDYKQWSSYIMSNVRHERKCEWKKGRKMYGSLYHQDDFITIQKKIYIYINSLDFDLIFYCLKKRTTETPCKRAHINKAKKTMRDREKESVKVLWLQERHIPKIPLHCLLTGTNTIITPKGG